VTFFKNYDIIKHMFGNWWIRREYLRTAKTKQLYYKRLEKLG